MVFPQGSKLVVLLYGVGTPNRALKSYLHLEGSKSFCRVLGILCVFERDISSI